MKKLMVIFAVIALVAFTAPAFAENPFMDVPSGHWAYDAVAQLAARGVASGYPDGSYKGGQPATRYEMASMVARAIALMDMEKASQQDVELLKKLVVEFSNELNALGVKVSELDKRVAVLEDNIGGWKLRGAFKFDAKFGHSDKGRYEYTIGNKRQFTKERFRLYLTKAIDENTFFFAEYQTGGGNADGMGDAVFSKWTNLYVDTVLPWDIDLRVGRFCVDFEDDYGLYTDNDSLFGDFSTDGFRLKKSIGMLDATAIVGRNDNENNEHMTYALDLSFQPHERFFVGATGYWMVDDSLKTAQKFGNVNTYGIYAGYGITPNVQLKGIYYFQDSDRLKDDCNAWKAILDVKQDALKFTSLWLEYSQEDNSFSANRNRYANGGGAYVGRNHVADSEKTKYFFALAEQQWNDKFSTFVRYAQAENGTKGIADAKEWGIGVGYQYTPAIFFELMYDQVDYGNGSFGQEFKDKESVVRFRTAVNF